MGCVARGHESGGPMPLLDAPSGVSHTSWPLQWFDDCIMNLLVVHILDVGSCLPAISCMELLLVQIMLVHGEAGRPLVHLQGGSAERASPGTWQSSYPPTHARLCLRLCLRPALALAMTLFDREALDAPVDPLMWG
eukprot:351335-Chlamydomonas_euryale.AAC.2